MKRLGKVAALLLVITALVWLTTLWQWQSRDLDPELDDVLIHLGLVPLVLTASLALVLFGMASLKRYAAAPVMSPAVAQPATVEVSPGPAPASTQHVLVLGSAARLRPGGSWSEAHAAIEAGDAKPELDPSLKDDAGLPVFTARIDDLDEQELADALDALVARLAAGDAVRWGGFRLAPEVLRALSLLGESLDDLDPILEAQGPTLIRLHGTWDRGASQRPTEREGDATPWLQCFVAIPASWCERTRELVTAWMADRTAPLEQAFAQAHQAAGAEGAFRGKLVQCHVQVADDPETFWQSIEQRHWPKHLPGKPPPLVVAAACDCLLGEASLSRMQAQRVLFSPVNAMGRVPGEAAAALLLATADWPAQESTADRKRLRRASLAERSTTADAAGRIGAQALIESIRDALETAGRKPESVQSVVSDLDHRGSRAGEVYEALQQVLPEVDATTSLLRLGVACGDLGLVRLLALTHLALGRASAESHAVLAIGVSPQRSRFALLIDGDEMSPASTRAVDATAPA